MDATAPKKPTRRTLAKQKTREKVLAAATALFNERGYDGATIRVIAKAAGMSTGAVFTSFADKDELFAAVLEAIDPHHVQNITGVRDSRASVQENVLAFCYFDYEHQLKTAQLYAASRSALWSSGSSESKIRKRNQAFRSSLLAIIHKEIHRHSVLAADVKADMICDLHFASIERVIVLGEDVLLVAGAFERQVGIILRNHN